MMRKKSWEFFISLLCLFQIACGEPPIDSSASIGNEVFLRVGESGLNTEDFNAAVEIAKIPYGKEASQNPRLLSSIRRQTLAELIAEMVMRERANELGLNVSEEELLEVVNSIEAGLDGALDGLLFQSVVARKVWEKRLAARLLMEKLVQVELEGKSAVTSKEIADYCRKAMPETNIDVRDIDKNMVEYLLRKKAEDAFEPWLHQLIKSYPIYVDQNVWERIAGTGE